MRAYAIRENELTATERFEDFHQRIGLRNKISNALMAIALFEANSRSSNLLRYISDGRDTAQECLSSLKEIEKDETALQHRYYCSKVLLDILTMQASQDLDRAKLKEYVSGFNAALEAFDKMKNHEEVDEVALQKAAETMKQIDKEMQSLYAKEESLYRGAFSSR